MYLFSYCYLMPLIYAQLFGFKYFFLIIIIYIHLCDLIEYFLFRNEYLKQVYVVP